VRERIVIGEEPANPYGVAYGCSSRVMWEAETDFVRGSVSKGSGGPNGSGAYLLHCSLYFGSSGFSFVIWDNADHYKWVLARVKEDAKEGVIDILLTALIEEQGIDAIEKIYKAGFEEGRSDKALEIRKALEYKY